MKKLLAILLVLALVMALPACKQEGGENTYTVWLYTAQDSTYYSTYEENPVLNYLLQREYAGKKITLKFQVPAAGQAQNNYQTMLSGGEYPDLRQAISTPILTVSALRWK